MKRSVLVATGTAVGVTAVVSYHAASPSTVVASLGSSTPTSSSKAHSDVAAGTASRSASPATHTSTTRTTSTASTTAAAGASTRSALGAVESYPYGELQVKVTEHGGRITDVSVGRLSVPEPQSGSIDQIAVPQLRQEVLAAQSAHIDGVSGASYTSQAYAQSVQSALDKLA